MAAPAALAESADEPPALVLPALLNTPATDRPLMREIGDDYIYAPPRPEPAPSVASAEDAGSDPWARIRASTRWPRSERAAVLAFREQYLREAVWVDRLLARGDIYIDHLVQRLDERYLPTELALLPAIESGYRPDVVSSGMAAGLWQIVPVTALEIGLERSAWVDGRADIVSSTRAAIDYLSYLNARFHGDWELTLAAYNAGPGRVRNAIRANRAAGRPTDFWSLRLPAETRDYVPKLLALVDLLKDPASGLAVPARSPDAGFVAVDVGFRIGVDRAAELAGVPTAELARLNAGLVHGVTAPDGPHRLYLPRGSAARFQERLAGTDRGELFALPMQHTVEPGETLSGIARRYAMEVARLMELNGLADPGIQAGQRLSVIDVGDRPVAEIEYVVSIGDTLSKIAQYHSVDRSAIRDAAGQPLSDDLIHPGEVLRIRLLAAATG